LETGLALELKVSPDELMVYCEKMNEHT
jgi:hypothetical protein